jgi:hypothetical protein
MRPARTQSLSRQMRARLRAADGCRSVGSLMPLSPQKRAPASVRQSAPPETTGMHPRPRSPEESATSSSRIGHLAREPATLWRMTEQHRRVGDGDLRVLRALGARAGSESPRRLREATGLPARTCTRVLSRLHAAGLLSERSKAVVRLSPAGWALLQRPLREVRPGTGGNARAGCRSQPVAFPPPPPAGRTAPRAATARESPASIEPASLQPVEPSAGTKPAASRKAPRRTTPNRQTKPADPEHEADDRDELGRDDSYLHSFVRGIAGGGHGQAASPGRSGFLQGFFGGG